MLAQEADPIDENLAEVVADREEPGREGLRLLGSDLARILLNEFVLDVDVLQLEGDDRPISGAREKCEGYQRAVSQLISVAAGMASIIIRT